eukprot:29739-Pelagococcus_subviridis.AAC.17
MASSIDIVRELCALAFVVEGHEPLAGVFPGSDARRAVRRPVDAMAVVRGPRALAIRGNRSCVRLVVHRARRNDEKK